MVISTELSETQMSEYRAGLKEISRAFLATADWAQLLCTTADRLTFQSKENHRKDHKHTLALHVI